MKPRLLLPFAAVMLVAPLAHADEDPKAKADALFREGERLFTAGEIATACDKFDQSLALDPALGTLINLGLCHEKQGRTATAHAELSRALEHAKQRNQAERVKLLEAELAKLGERLARVRIVFQRAEPAQVSLDGKVVEPGRLDAPFAIDPGTHTFVVSAPQKRTQTLTVQINDAPATTDVNVPVLEPERELGGGPYRMPVGDPNPGSTQRFLGWSFVGLGVVGVGVGTVFGLLASSSKSDADAKCTSGVTACSSRDGVDANDSAHSRATVSTIAFAIGLVSGAAGVTLLVTAPKRGPQAALRARPGGLSLEGSF